MLDWKDAPKWAKYAAADFDGSWYWYENEPCIVDGVWWAERGKSKRAFFPDMWASSLTKRPEE